MKAPAPTQRLIALWHRREFERGVVPEPSDKRLARAFKDLFATAQEDVERAEAAITAYFDDESPPAASTRWSIGYFQTHFRAYLPPSAAPPAAPPGPPRAPLRDERPAPASPAEAAAAVAAFRARFPRKETHP